MEVTGVKPSSFQHVVLRQIRLLTLLSYLWHYNRYFAFSRDNRTHPTPNRREDLTSNISSHRERLYYGKMAAVSVMRMRKRSYPHKIALTSECKSFWGEPERVHAVNLEDECAV